MSHRRPTRGFDRTPTPVVSVDPERSRRRDDVDNEGVRQRQQILSKDEIAEACQNRCRESGLMHELTTAVEKITVAVASWRGGIKVALWVLSSVGIVLATTITLAATFGPAAFRNAVAAEFDQRFGALLDRMPKKVDNHVLVPSAHAGQAAPGDWIGAQTEKGSKP